MIDQESSAVPIGARDGTTDVARSASSEACEFGDRKSPLSNDAEEKLFRPGEDVA